jgi:hypothetical protein
MKHSLPRQVDSSVTQEIPLRFIETRFSATCSQQSDTGPNPELTENSLHPYTISVIYTLISPFHLRLDFLTVSSFQVFRLTIYVLLPVWAIFRSNLNDIVPALSVFRQRFV